ncbi:MAG: hypothetical protein FWB74_07935 [Defluviitaleaceae bacterium]|nr:hypothetical protein [Defluviitaleaceae bacterium]
MSNQNDRGGGFLLWGINFVSSKIRNRKIKKFNTQARGVSQYANVTTDFLLPAQSYQDNIIVSGGSGADRLKFCEKILQNARGHHRPVVVLTSGNISLENIILQNGLGMVASRSRRIYDAFTFLELSDIYQVVLASGSQKYGISPTGRYILQIVYDILQAQNLRPYFANFASFTYHQIPERINDCLLRGLITQTKADELSNLFAMGKSELAKIDAFFHDASSQMAHIAETSPNSAGASSALSAIWNKQTILIDVGSLSSSILLESVASTLLTAVQKGLEFSLLVDNIPAPSGSPLQNILGQNSKNNNIICADDAFIMLGSDERAFSSIVGLTDKTILLSHSSNISSEMWSRHIGDYEKIDTSQSRGGGWFQSSRWGYVSNQSQTETLKREQKIKPEEINRLGQSQVVAYDSQEGVLIQANVI